MENDEQEEHVQEFPVNELISTRLLSYQLNKWWETDEEIRKKAMDVSFFVIFVVVHKYIFKVQTGIKLLVIDIRYHVIRH